MMIPKHKFNSTGVGPNTGPTAQVLNLASGSTGPGPKIRLRTCTVHPQAKYTTHILTAQVLTSQSEYIWCIPSRIGGNCTCPELEYTGYTPQGLTLRYRAHKTSADPKNDQGNHSGLTLTHRYTAHVLTPR